MLQVGPVDLLFRFRFQIQIQFIELVARRLQIK